MICSRKILDPLSPRFTLLNNPVLCMAFLLLQFTAVAASPTAVYFRVSNGDASQDFIVELIATEKIQQARAIVSGAEKQVIHVAGTVISHPAPYNKPSPDSPLWDFHLDPSTVSFFHFGPEYCNQGLLFVSEHVKAGDLNKVLPTGHWCPRGYTVVAELTP
jgi:hypothetical protein